MINWENINAQLKNDSDYGVNKELAQAIVKNHPKAVHYYLTAIGMPIMKHIERTIMHRDIIAEYYMFLSAPFDEVKGEACWHRVDLYQGIDCLLSSYTSNITCRHFYKEAAKETKQAQKENELLDFVDYESLIKCETAEEKDEGCQTQCVRKAYQMLSEREQAVLHYLIIKNMPALDAYPHLSVYLHPHPLGELSSEEVKEQWTPKQRQNALSLLKGRALKHLQDNYISIKKQYE